MRVAALRDADQSPDVQHDAVPEVEGPAVEHWARKEGLIGNKPFEQPIDFAYFDLWHYYGRTSKHGAFMGGADFIQWHGNYPILKSTVEINAMAAELRRGHGK